VIKAYKISIESRAVWLSILFTIIFQAGVFGQTDEQKSSIIEQRIEQIAGSLDEGVELDYTTLFEDLLYYFEHPLNLNNANVDELRELYLLDDIQINNLLTHINKYGLLRSVFELQAVEGFDLATIRDLEPFVTVTPNSGMKGVSLKTILKEGTNDLFLRYKRNIEKPAGFLPDPTTGKPDFAGTPNYMYSRYRFMFRKNISVGFTMENDPGESLKGGPDFASAHAMFAGDGLLRKAIAGDYQVLFGQGLTYWNGLGFGKSPFVLNVKKNALGLRPYTSVQEGNYLRGGAITLGVKDIELTTFYSQKRVDANLVLLQDTLLADDDQAIATSISISGLHRTEGEIADKRSLGETVYGGNLRYNTRALAIGFTGVRTQFDQSLLPAISPYEINRFTGKSNTNLGVDYQGVLGNINFFGEVSRSANGGLATINGLVASLHPSLSVSIVQRHFQPEYQALKVNVFGENNTTANNERGIFAGIQANLNNKWTMTGYVDLVRYPWLRFRVDAPSNFMDQLIQLNYKPDRKHEFYIRYRNRTNAQNTDNDVIITYPVAYRQQNIRVHGVYQVHPNVQMKTRAEWTTWEKEGDKQKGVLVYQDLIYKKLGSPYTISLRYALFDTDGWNTKLYAYESDVLYAFSIPPYYGKGSRFYALVKYDVTRKIDLWVRYGSWLYTDRRVISSGTNEILGNGRSDIHIQLRVRF
jgi:hypothetical protein